MDDKEKYQLNKEYFSSSAKLQIQFADNRLRTFKVGKPTAVTPEMSKWLNNNTEWIKKGLLVRSHDQAQEG